MKTNDEFDDWIEVIIGKMLKYAKMFLFLISVLFILLFCVDECIHTKIWFRFFPISVLD